MKTVLRSIAMLGIVGALISFIPRMKAGKVVDEFDFGTSKAGSDWAVMNDGVMGGLSKGSFSLTENSLILKGEISLANNGGFSSVRGPWGKMDLSEFKKLRSGTVPQARK